MGYGPAYPGGAEQQAGLLATELARRGRRVIVYAPSSSVDRGSISHRNPRVVPVPALGLPHTRTATYLPMLGLVSLSPGFEHPRDPPQPHGLAPLWRSGARKPGHGCPHRREVRVLRTGRRRREPDSGTASAGRPCRMALKADRIVALTPAICDELLEVGYPPGQIRVIPNGVRLVRGVAPAPDLASLPHPRVLFAGRLTAQKGILPFLDAWAIVHEALPDATLLVAGRGDLAEAVAARAAAPDLGGSVRLLGHRTDMDALIAAADAVVLPSRSEGMSNVALQTLASQEGVLRLRHPGHLRGRPPSLGDRRSRRLRGVGLGARGRPRRREAARRHRLARTRGRRPRVRDRARRGAL